MNASPKDVSLEPRSGSQDLHLLKSSIKEVSLNPLSPVANIVTPASNDKRRLPCGRTASYLVLKIAEMENEMAVSRKLFLSCELDLAHSDLSERKMTDLKKDRASFRREYNRYKRRLNDYQRCLTEGRNK